MPHSTSDVSKLEADGLATGDSGVRRIDGEAARLRPGVAAARAAGASTEWAFERSAREFSRLREALDERNEGIRRLRAREQQHVGELNATRVELASAWSDLAMFTRDAAALQHQLAAAAAELQTTEGALNLAHDELDTSNFHLAATRAELKAVHAEFTTVQVELGESCMAMKALRAELDWARRELQSMTAGAALDVDDSPAAIRRRQG